MGAPNADDAAILDYAVTKDYVLLTHDLDFSAILAASHSRAPSAVQIRDSNVSPDILGKYVVAALRQVEADIAGGALLTIDGNRTRLRLLPLRR